MYAPSDQIDPLAREALSVLVEGVELPVMVIVANVATFIDTFAAVL